MSARQRRCSECGGDLGTRAPQSKTCGDICRSKRSRRLRANRKRGGEAKAMPEHQKTMQEIVRGEQADVAEKIVQEELRPVVREAITEDTYRAIQDLVGLTPQVVKAIAEDLDSEDAVVRQRAYSLVAKYTFGHPAIVKSGDEDSSKQLIVNFALPRPGDDTAIEGAAVELEAEEFRQCDLCHADKPVTEFVAGSSRCVSCYERQQEHAKKLMEGTRGN